MPQSQNINVQKESEVKKITNLILGKYKLFILSVVAAIGLAFLINHYSIPLHRISAAILIKEDRNRQEGGDVNDFLNSSLFGKDQVFQNELWVFKSSLVIERTLKNLDLAVSYYVKTRFQYRDDYQNVPFKISFLKDHPQPIDIKFHVSFLNENSIQIRAESKKAHFYNYETDKYTHTKDNWVFIRNTKFGELIETPDLAFIINKDSTKKSFNYKQTSYAFDFETFSTLGNNVKSNLEFNVVDRMATVIQINLIAESVAKGIDMVNELMNVYSEQNLERKNHIASVTIDYIEKQLNEISDSLNQTEDNLQNFRSSNQLLNITDQSTALSTQYMNLQNQLAELISQKRYYDYVTDLLANDNFSNIMLPASIGIPDQLLNNLMSQLITSQAQRSNLIENNQERNPLVQKLGIEIANLKKTISENISAVSKTASISIDEMKNRIRKIEAEISRLPITQRRLGTIERQYRLNDAIYNYLLEKRAEAKITTASNLPDNIIIEPAKMSGSGPISPNKQKNYAIALFLGLVLPFCYLMIKSALNNKIESQEDIERLTDTPVLGKILHNRLKTNNVMFEFPKADIAESFRALRTNLDFYVRGGLKKVIMVTSCLESEGKSFVASNLAMSYAQLGRKTILVNYDFRKPMIYFKEQEESHEGLSSYMINKTTLEKIIIKSPLENLHYITAGILPPNPVELIALEKTEKLLTDLKNDYDIIVLDTTPLAQVTDAYLLINHSEIKIIVVRQNRSLKNAFSLIMKDLHQKNVSNICIVYNDVRLFREQYGYAYGYKKGHKKGKWKT
jgi:capsular exopolysaccharide synthesis family protein